MESYFKDSFVLNVLKITQSSFRRGSLPKQTKAQWWLGTYLKNYSEGGPKLPNKTGTHEWQQFQKLELRVDGERLGLCSSSGQPSPISVS